MDTEQLTENLGGNTELAHKAVEAFLRASVAATPSAKQSSMAAQNRPSFVFAVVRNGGAPASLANAFERPVVPNERRGGLVKQSIEALTEYWDTLAAVYATDGIKALAVCQIGDSELKGLQDARVSNVEEVFQRVSAALPGGGAS